MKTCDLHYRQFENGVVVINSGEDPFEGKIPLEAGLSEVKDVYSHKQISVSAGDIEVAIPPHAGRVYWGAER